MVFQSTLPSLSVSHTYVSVMGDFVSLDMRLSLKFLFGALSMFPRSLG